MMNFFKRFFDLKRICTGRYNLIKEYILFIVPIKKACKNKKICFLILTPIHGNLGDHAIALSETLMLNKLGIKYYELSGHDLCYLQRIGKLNIMNGHTIIVNGGGNLGTLWFDVEKLFREIIQSNTRSKIILMPNTIYYEDSPFGEEELKHSIQIYNLHQNLYLFAREKASYFKMKEIYNHVELVPDMVLALEKQKPKENRCGCILCLRKDVERIITGEQKEELNNVVEGLFGKNVECVDTVANHNIPFEYREKELNCIWKQFRSSELIITDRLHGMIFAAITETPCIVLNSKSPKVRGCFEWIKDLGYIKFCEDFNDIPKIYKLISSINCKYDNSMLMPYYMRMEEVIKTVVK